MGCSISSIVCFSESFPLESNIWMPRPPSWSACLCLIDLLPSPTSTARRTRRSSPIRTTTWRTKTQSMLLHNLESQVKMPRRVDLMFSEQIVDDHGPSDNGLRFHTAWSSINPWANLTHFYLMIIVITPRVGLGIHTMETYQCSSLSDQG